MLGSLVVAGSLLTLGYTKEIVRPFISDKDTAKSVTIVLAVLAIYAVDFAINATMSGARSLVVDALPLEKQQAGAAWGKHSNAIQHDNIVANYAASRQDVGGRTRTRLWCRCA